MSSSTRGGERQTMLLAVDDQPDNLFVLQQVVEELLPECRVLVAASAEVGLALAAREPLAGAIIDVQMPGVDGIELCRRLRAAPATAYVPVILITSHSADATLKARGLDAGADDFISRPIDNLELVARIRVMLRIRRAEEELQQANARLESAAAHRTTQLEEALARSYDLVRALPAGLLLFRRDGERLLVVDANPAAERLLEAPSGALLGRELGAVFPGLPAELAGALRATIAGVVVERTARPGELLAGRPGRVWAFRMGSDLLGLLFSDISDETRARAQLAQNDRLTSMGMLAAGVAHEINNPLTYVLHGLEALGEDLPRLTQAGLAPGIGAELLAQVREAEGGVRRVQTIVADLKTFTRRDDDEPLAAVDITRVLESAISMAACEVRGRASLVRDFAPVPPALGRDGQLMQVFLNLLVNAAQAIGEGGAAANEIRVRLTHAAAEVVVEVRDNGPGLTAEARQHLFEPFFTTKPAGVGSGLGLSICQAIVTGCGGTITVESEPGRGTRVEVRLPVAAAPPPRVAAPPAEEPAPRRGRLLVVDDEPVVGTLIGRLLARDHEVVVVRSGVEGQRRLAEDPRFDLVLCDLLMPGVTGKDLYNWLGARHADLARRMIFMTGGASTTWAATFLSTVPNTILEKPFDARSLRGAVQRALGAQADAGPTA